MGIPDLQKIIFSLWKKNYERTGLGEIFKPVFIRYIGIPNTENEYNNILKTILNFSNTYTKNTIVFEGPINSSMNFDLLMAIKQNLETINISNLNYDDFIMFSDKEVNNCFINALQYTINLAINNENFKNRSIRNNFICELLLYFYDYISTLEFSNYETCKCIFYGSITKNQAYFLICLYKMGFDIIYINPIKDEYFNLIDIDNLSLLKQYKQLSQLISLQDRCQKGTVIDRIESVTLQVEQQLEQELYDGTNFFKPWQYRDGYTNSILFNGNLIDLEQNINQPSKLRQGFFVKGKKVNIPHFFMIINGENEDINEYIKILNICQNNDKYKLILHGNFADELKIWSPEQKSQVVFCQNGQKTFDINAIKNLEFYKFSNYNNDVQDFYLNKINEILQNNSMFVNQIDNPSKKIEFLNLFLNINEEIFEMISNFDFTNDIPKLIIFLEDKDKLTEKSCIILGLLSVIGFDIIIFSPAGMSGIAKYIQENNYTNIMLDNMNYKSKFSNYQYKKKNNFFYGILKGLV